VSDVPRYRRIYANEWHHPEFRRLNDSARVVRFYVTAGPQTTSVGCFRLSTALAVEDLGGTAEQFEERLETVCQAFEWAWDPVARVIWIRDWFDLNPPASPNVVASWAKLLRNHNPIRTFIEPRVSFFRPRIDAWKADIRTIGGNEESCRHAPCPDVCRPHIWHIAGCLGSIS
jgi:hypothetical protein